MLVHLEMETIQVVSERPYDMIRQLTRSVLAAIASISIRKRCYTQLCILKC